VVALHSALFLKIQQVQELHFTPHSWTAFSKQKIRTLKDKSQEKQGNSLLCVASVAFFWLLLAPPSSSWSLPTPLAINQLSNPMQNQFKK